MAGKGGEPVGRGARALEPQHFVGQPLDEIATGRVGDQPAETLLTAAFGPGRRRLGCPQQRVGDLDRSCDTRAVVHDFIMARAAILATMTSGPALTIGELSRRTGVAPSALRFYEDSGLIHAERTSGGQRRYRRDVIRRVSFIRVAQQIGLGLGEIGAYMSELPDRRTPDRTDWERVADSWRPRLDDQIALLERLRERLSGCIGCGCLSLDVCPLVNPADQLAGEGSGPRRLLHD